MNTGQALTRIAGHFSTIKHLKKALDPLAAARALLHVVVEEATHLRTQPAATNLIAEKTPQQLIAHLFFRDRHKVSPDCFEFETLGTVH